MDTLIQPKLRTTHPLAGTKMTGADIIIQVLADEGVETIFGYSGGAILPTYDAVFRYNKAHSRDGVEPMPLIVPANEQGAGFMAAGYARASGRVGVVMVTSGPGATNCVTPVRDCMADSMPIVVICGQVATAAIGTDAFQEAPVTAVMGSVAKHVFLVTDPLRLESTDSHRVRDRAHRPARPGRRRRAEGRAELDGHVPGRELPADSGLPATARERRAQHAVGSAAARNSSRCSARASGR